MHRIYRATPLVQEAYFWCTKWAKRCCWYRKHASGVPNLPHHLAVSELPDSHTTKIIRKMKLKWLDRYPIGLASILDTFL